MKKIRGYNMDEKTPSISFQHRMDNIKEDYNELGNLAIKLNADVVKLLEDYDETVYRGIFENSNTLDIKTINLERVCIKFMATEQPLAKDLMFIESTLRVISHIKRVGHLCLKIAESIKNIQGVNIPKKILNELALMGDYIQFMLKKSFMVFLNHDLDKARELAIDDDKIDELYESILNEVTTTMVNDEELVPYIVDTIFLARHFERIADKAVSIGSRTIFMITLKRPGIDD